LSLGEGNETRDFIKVIAGSAAAWPLAARAQQAGKLPTIGLLGADATARHGAREIALIPSIYPLPPI